MNFPNLRNAALGLFVVGLASVLALALSEFALRFLHPSSASFRVLLPNQRTVVHPDTSVVHGVSGAARFTVNSEGIRGREWGSDEGEYRILAIGGSTTESLYHDDSETWPALLEAMLDETADGRGVWVGNVGHSGHTSRDHAVQVKYLSAQHPSLDALIILVGVNDMTLALMEGDAYETPPPITDPRAERLQIRRAFTIVPGKLHRPGTNRLAPPDAPWYATTALYQLFTRARFRIRDWIFHRGIVQDVQGRFIEELRARRRNAAGVRHELPDLAPALHEYARNLNVIVDETQSRGMRLVFLTQPVIWRAVLTPEEESLLWLGGAGDFLGGQTAEYYSVAALAEAMDRYNTALLNICEHREVECLDLAALLPKDRSVFYDDAHFTEKGARLVAERIAAFLRSTPPFSRDHSRCADSATANC
jgi:lysophospholipase L1-like esterase